ARAKNRTVWRIARGGPCDSCRVVHAARQRRSRRSLSCRLWPARRHRIPFRVKDDKTMGKDSLRGQVSDEEWKARVQLAAAYRIFDHLGWTELIYNHISLRLPGSDTHF